MSNEAITKTICPYCTGHVEFPWDGFGKEIACPHCNQNIGLAEGVARALQAAPVRPPAIITALYAVAVLQFIGCFVGFVLCLVSRSGNGVPIIVGGVIGGIITCAFAKLIEYSHAASERMARIEVHLQTLTNERK